MECYIKQRTPDTGVVVVVVVVVVVIIITDYI